MYYTNSLLRNKFEKYYNNKFEYKEIVKISIITTDGNKSHAMNCEL